VGAAKAWYEGISPVGPLASFDGSDSWVDHPYRAGVALIGDAAAASDPSYGQGLSLTCRDARVLRDCLLAHENWDIAGHAYANAHDSYYRALHKATGWFWQLFYETGPTADARRAKAFPLIADDPTRMPDFLLSGPEVPLDENVKRRFFGEDELVFNASLTYYRRLPTAGPWLACSQFLLSSKEIFYATNLIGERTIPGLCTRE
jgi:menaquinone-9 beta-reductase